MSHKWLHTIDCKVLNENNTSEKVAKCLVMPQASLDLPSRDHAAQFLTCMVDLGRPQSSQIVISQSLSFDTPAKSQRQRH